MEGKIRFADSTAQVLTTISEKKGISIGEVIRNALSIYWWMYREQAAGSRFLVQRGEFITELRIPDIEADGAEERNVHGENV